MALVIAFAEVMIKSASKIIPSIGARCRFRNSPIFVAYFAFSFRLSLHERPFSVSKALEFLVNTGSEQFVVLSRVGFGFLKDTHLLINGERSMLKKDHTYSSYSNRIKCSFKLSFV